MNRHSAFSRGLAAFLATMVMMPFGSVAFADSSEAAPAEAANAVPVDDSSAADNPTMSYQDVADSLFQRDGARAPATAEAPVDAPDVDRLTVSRQDVDPNLVVSKLPLTTLAPTATGAKSATTAQAIPLPKAEGSITGMGESFSPDLGTGAATYSVPFQLAPGRGGVQPALGLSYSSTSGNGTVGMGWSLGVPFIGRQADRGMPRYRDSAAWTPEEDRYFYNGGQELVPVDSAAIEVADCGAPGCAPIPHELAGWQQYRARVEGAFMRFFRSPDGRRWVVHAKDGTRYDFGQLPAGDGPADAVSTSVAAVQSEYPSGQGRVYRWLISRTADPHGSSIYYQHREEGGQRYLADLYYTSPDAACGSLADAAARMRCQAPLSDYGRRIHVVYEPRPDVTTTFTSGWAIATSQRVKRVEMTSAEGAPGRRTLVRRYHLSYDPFSYWSLLTNVQLEGRPQHVDPLTLAKVGDATVDENSLGDAIVGVTLPPLVLHYQSQPISLSFALGFGGTDATVHHATSSPPYSVGANADLFDVNSDGLADLVVTDPAHFHTASGAPAVGVYFNGFSGGDTLPAAAATFSSAVAAAMRSDLSQVMRLTNFNISPMDVDGDGRADYLHMPRQRQYGYFTPVRSGPAEAATPAQQGWEWAYLDRSLPMADPDPRIDFAHDSARLRQFDVNGDHLVDIVRTTGTSIQVWLNLGWLPGGDGRYGSYTYNAASHAFALSTAPIETCLPVAGTPLDFGDPEVRLGDMNGDGITDIVRARANRVIYWPGRGEGAFGTGDAACSPGLVAGRYVEMAQPPTQLNAELADVYFADMNADGVEDIVQVRFGDVDVWFNYGGSRFSSRVRMSGMPYAPAYDTRVRLVDVDGSGTVDVLYARANDWQWVDPMGGKRPRLLTSVENGLGGATELQYGTSVDDYLRDLAEADACTGNNCKRFLWTGTPTECDAKVQGALGHCGRRSGGSPVVSTVIRQVQLDDRMNLVGTAATKQLTRFAYHDGYYEGVEQEFRGFGAADTVIVGDESSPSMHERTFLHQGRRPELNASDRLVDNPEETLKGLAYLSEIFDEQGVYESSVHTSYTIRRAAMGLSGVAVAYAFASSTDSFFYDTGPFTATPSATTVLPSVTRWDGTVNAPAEVHIRGARYAHTRSTLDVVDGVGQALQSTAYGRIRGEFGETPDERIVSHATFENVTGSATGWEWRKHTDYLDGAGVSTRLGDSTMTHSPEGDTVRSVTAVTQAMVPTFDGDAEAEGFGARAPEAAEASTEADAWGSPKVTCIGGDAHTRTGCLRLGFVRYDSDYALTPDLQVKVTRPIGGGALDWLQTEGVWDRGMLQSLDVKDENSQHSESSYDGLGRLTLFRRPDVRGCTGRFPTLRIEYLDTTNPAQTPLSRMHTTSFLSCTDASKTIDSYSYVDGFGKGRAVVSTGPDSARPWVKGGLVERNRRGGAKAAYEADFFTGDPGDFGAVMQPPALAPSRAYYDAFGRQVLTTAQDGSPTRTVHHALSADVWDANDLGSDPTFAGTPTTQRSDGHGRTIDQVLRNRQPGASAIEIDRVFASYRADGVVTRIERAQTSDEKPRATTTIVGNHIAARDFFYDSMGRRVAATDPNTDNRTNGATWRYLFNRVGDLVALRDPRGCGQNFYYDLVGRAVGETYVGCAEAQLHEMTVATLPAGAVGWTQTTAAVAVDVLNSFDSYAGTWAPTPTSLKDYPVDAGGLKGHLAATTDRGRRSVFAYDTRGTPVWEARQMAVIMNYGYAALQLATNGPPPGGDAPDGQAVVYDAVHTYVRSSAKDHAGRPTGLVLSADPDFPTNIVAPRVAGRIDYDRRGLPLRSDLQLITGGGAPVASDGALSFGGASIDTRPIVKQMEYARDGLLTHIVYGDDRGGTRTPTQTALGYDVRRRPKTSLTTRAPTAVDVNGDHPLAAVSVVQGSELQWDPVSNLTRLDDKRLGDEWPGGYRPQSTTVTSDALYHVVGADYAYTDDAGAGIDGDVGTDWRAEQLRAKSADPMRQKPAPMIAAAPTERVASQTWSFDWLGNSTSSTDDAHAFYERSLGTISNGTDLTSTERPSALYLAADLAGPPVARGGWVEVDYGVSGNVVDLTAHAQCVDPPAKVCADPGTGTLATRRAFLKANCTCQQEQYYQYRWDEVNRLAEARRYDRTGGTGNWMLNVRQYYRYDAGNARTVKHTHDLVTTGDPNHRYTLYVFPGDLERRGLVRAADQYKADGNLDTQTEYLISGARVVWQAGNPLTGLDADHRISLALSDIIGSTSAVIDLRSGELTQYGTFYPNGARETLRGSPELVPFEPLGFTGKEDDQEVGLVYFGERYLVPSLGRWLSPDPLETHSMAAGEALNSFHYISGNLLQARDTLGLEESKLFEAGQGASGGDGLSPMGDDSPRSGERISFVETISFSTTGDNFAQVVLESGEHLHIENGKYVNETEYFSSLDVARMLDTDSPRHAGFVSLMRDLNTLKIGMQEMWNLAGIACPVIADADFVAWAMSCEGEECIDVIGAMQFQMLGKGMGEEPGGGKRAVIEEEPPTCSGGCFVAGTPVATLEGEVAIDGLRVGDRVRTSRSVGSGTEVDASWRAIDLEIANPDVQGEVVRVTLLRSPTWMTTEHVVVGGSIALSLPEVAIEGAARVVGVRRVARDLAREGRVVTGTFARVSSSIYALTLDSGETLEVTGGHRLYSADRDDWTRVDALVKGELLMTATGPVRVQHAEHEARTATVYNIEVESEHTYVVGGTQVWSHNQCACEGGGGGAGDGAASGGRERITSGSQVTEEVIRDAMKGAPLQSQQAGGVSLPRVQRYVDRLIAGEVAPAIKVDGGMIVDGNHRYIAGRIVGQEPPIQPYIGGRPGSAVPWESIPVDPVDW